MKSSAPKGSFLFAQQIPDSKTCHMSFSSEEGNFNVQIDQRNLDKMIDNLKRCKAALIDGIKFRAINGFRDGTDYILVENEKTYIVYGNKKQLSMSYDLEECQRMVDIGVWEIIE